MVKTPRTTYILIFCIFSCIVNMGYGQNFNWNPIKYKGSNYVSIDQMKTFYGFQRMVISGSSVTLENKGVKLKLKLGSHKCYMNGVLFSLSSPVVVEKGKFLISRTDLVKLIDPVMRPSYINSAKIFSTVVIDAGHGGSDSGAVGHLSTEKVYALKVARLVRDMLEGKGYRVVMTRDSDTFVSLANRVAIANRYPNAIFISIHFNAARSSQASGIETFTVSPVGVPHVGRGIRDRDFEIVPGNIKDSASIALATAVHGRSLLYLNNPNGHNFKIIDRGIKRARFNVLTGIRIPAILFEGGFLSNRVEGAKIHSPVYQKTLSSAIVRAVDVYRASIARRKVGR